MWVKDFRNKNVVEELKLDKATVVNWFNFCRQEGTGSKKNWEVPTNLFMEQAQI